MTTFFNCSYIDVYHSFMSAQEIYVRSKEASFSSIKDLEAWVAERTEALGPDFRVLSRWERVVYTPEEQAAIDAERRAKNAERDAIDRKLAGAAALRERQLERWWHSPKRYQ